MTTIGTVYVVRAVRADGGHITYRTTDKREATAVAARLGVTVTTD